MDVTYTQKDKNYVRHSALFYAVDILTKRRYEASCVDKFYVRKVYDHFNSMDDCKEKQEAKKIDKGYINQWEKLYDTCLSFRKPEDLNVCYLSGPEPQNDFTELIELGINPQNIWAFENDSIVYSQAIQAFNSPNYPQPKIVNGSIEHFFKQIPKKFDIIYIDACGSIPSSQHCLRMISTLFKYYRLNSPGVLLTNFACPNNKDYDQYSEVISKYLIYKKHGDLKLKIEDGKIVSKEYDDIYKKTKEDFRYYYGEFITSIIRDIAALIIPFQRFVNSEYIKTISNDLNPIGFKLSENGLNSIKNNSLYKFFYLENMLDRSAHSSKRMKLFINELSGLDNYPIGIFNSLKMLYKMRNETQVLSDDIKVIKHFFDNSKEIYQFLDKPSSSLFFDLIVNQFAYPMHSNSQVIERYVYKAKETEMFMDLIVFDECRYIYDWLPPIHQIQKAFTNPGWQYIFRFAVDGLVKQRIDYNNEFFYQGSVIQKSIEGFDNKTIKDRMII